jgi:precorrin-2 dehydrogenase/sirohydrochlorin ferrochelatase
MVTQNIYHKFVVYVSCKWRKHGELLLLIDLRVEDKAALVIGGGKLGERKVRSLLDHNALVTVISETLTPALKTLAEEGKITFIEANLEKNKSLLDTSVSKAFLVYAATNNRNLNREISEKARENKVLVCAVDMPEICDFYSPAVFHRGSIRVGICTDGKSPIMSKVLKERLSAEITEIDSLNVELQSYSRELAKKKINDSAVRRDTLYEILNDSDIHRILESGRLEEAKTAAQRLIKAASQKQSCDD